MQEARASARRASENRTPSPAPSLAPGMSPGIRRSTKLARSPRIVTGDDHDAEMRDQRGERVVGDLGRRARDGADERALAGVGEAENADIGQHLELEAEVFRFASLARLGAPRGAIVGRREMHVAAPAPPASRHDLALSGFADVEAKRAGVSVEDLGADRDANLESLRRRGRSSPSPCRARRARRAACADAPVVERRLPASPMNTTSPPRPPSPPEGPPLGTYFSRRNATAPLPPSPATTWNLHSSMNFMGEVRS